MEGGHDTGPSQLLMVPPAAVSWLDAASACSWLQHAFKLGKAQVMRTMILQGLASIKTRVMLMCMRAVYALISD